MSQLRPGDLVECVNNSPVLKQSRTMPELDRLYTVELVRRSGDGDSVRLVELTPDCHRGGSCRCGTCGWDGRRFRLIYRPHPNKLAMFTELLRRSERPRFVTECS